MFDGGHISYLYHHSPLNIIGLPIIFILTFSLIWGPAGLSIGQLIYGIVFYIYSHFSNNDLFTYIFFYPLITLLIGSFIYKFYYSFNFKNLPSIQLNNIYSLVKIIVTILITEAFYMIISYSVYIDVLGIKFTKFDFFDHYFTIVYVIFSFTLLFTLILSLKDVNIYKPEKSEHKILSKYFKSYSNYIIHYYPIIINLLVILFTIVLIAIGVSNNEILTNKFYNKNTLLICLVIVILVIQKPITNVVVIKKNKSIAEFLILIVTILFTIITSIYIYLLF